MTRPIVTPMAGFVIRANSTNKMQAAKPRCYSFPPIVGSTAKVLILGSMPGIASLKAQQYYAHPRNAFWPVMAALFSMQADWSYARRCQHLTEAGIAVWDVLKACHRPGSLDQHIDPASIEINDFQSFFKHYPGIKAVFFNGGKAEQLFRRHILPSLSHPPDLTRLPSTSPAHASLSFSQKLAAWQVIQLD